MRGTPPRIEQRSLAETQALTIGGISGALVTVGIWAAKQWGVDIPATLAPPLTTIVSAIGVGLLVVGRWLRQWMQKF